MIKVGNVSWAIQAVNDSISSYYNHSIENLYLLAPLDSPTFTTAFTATGLVSEADLDLSDITLADFINDPGFTANGSDVKFTNLTVQGTTNTSIGDFFIGKYNSSCSGFRLSTTGGWMLSCS